MNAFFSLLTFFAAQPWAIPVIGVLVGSLAFWIGRRCFAARPAPAEKSAVQPTATVLSSTRMKGLDRDRRSAPRRRGNRVEVFLNDDASRPPILGWVVDRSLGGLRLCVEKPLNEGAVFNVRPRQAPRTAPWMTVEVRSCRPDDSVWEVGCCFLKPPMWNDLLLFG